MQTGTWNDWNGCLWLWHFGYVKMQAPESTYCETRWLTGNLYQQDTVLCSKCGSGKCISVRVVIGSSMAEVHISPYFPTFLYSLLFCSILYHLTFQMKLISGWIWKISGWAVWRKQWWRDGTTTSSSSTNGGTWCSICEHAPIWHACFAPVTWEQL